MECWVGWGRAHIKYQPLKKRKKKKEHTPASFGTVSRMIRRYIDEECSQGIFQMRSSKLEFNVRYVCTESCCSVSSWPVLDYHEVHRFFYRSTIIYLEPLAFRCLINTSSIYSTFLKKNGKKKVCVSVTRQLPNLTECPLQVSPIGQSTLLKSI